ncbi:MAG: hypothetical protein AAE977_03940 [Thermoplasmataceae archaeon]|jgi:serine/threonine protein phosphatase PrpC
MIVVKDFHAPKLGSRETDYEDAFAYDLELGRFAVADGASDSIFSGLWARSLSETFVNSNLKTDNEETFIHDLVRISRDKWYREIKWNDLKLFVKNKAINGSFSTFIGVETVHSDSFERLKITSVGDSCFFYINGSELVSFPLSRPEDFNISPMLIWSGYGAPFTSEFRWKSPVYKSLSTNIPGNEFVLATDALSKWIMEFYPESWEIIHGSNLREYFEEAVKKKQIRNDDLTLVIVEIETDQ